MHPYLNIAVAAARSAGRIIAQAADRTDRLDVATKTAPNDLVTNIDKAAEAEIITHIQKAYPDHGILGEENGEIAGGTDNEVVWIIDPIDGTYNFVHGYPYFCVSIGVQVRGIMHHAVVYNPVSNELFTATKGSGAQRDGRRIRVSTCTSLDRALVSPAFAYKRANESFDACMARWQRVLGKVANMRRGGAAALDLAYLAAGRIDAMWEGGLGPWDMAAGALLVREAGGFVTDLNGEDKFMESGSLVAGTPKIFTEFLGLLRG